MTVLKLSSAFRFRETCLFCNSDQQSGFYTCQCADEAWKHQYRSYDLEINYDRIGRDKIIRSFYHYNFNDPQGMLQYEALPNRSYQGEDVLTVGVTPLFLLENISARLDTQLYIKCEGHNPSGCFKDRETLMCLLNSRKRGLDKSVIYSSGNAAASASIFAQKNKRHLITFLPGDTYEEKINFIRNHGSDAIVIGDKQISFEVGYRLFAAANKSGYFLQSGYDNWSVNNPYRVQGDKTTAIEIIHQLSTDGKTVVPDFVIVPSANGSCLAGMWKGFMELKQLGIIDSLPKIVSAGIRNANSIFKAVQEGELTKPVRCDLSLLAAEDADIGSIILAEEGYDSIEAAKAVVASGGISVEIGQSDIADTYQLFLQEEMTLAEDENIMPEPASLISIAAVEQLKKQQLLDPGHLVVSIITGSGFKARKKIKKIMADDPESLEIAEEILDRKIADQYPEASRQGRKIVVPPDINVVLEAFNFFKK